MSDEYSTKSSQRAGDHQSNAMPGRPKMTAKRVTELEERARVLQSDVHLAAPRQYLECDKSGALKGVADIRSDPLELGQAWRNALDAAEDAYFALVELASILREKAGIKWVDKFVLEDWGPGDTPTCRRIRKISSGSDETDTPAPSDPELGNPETTETPQAVERKPDDTPDSADTRSARAQEGAQPGP